MNLNVSMKEAAKMLSISAERMQALLEAGEIPAWREGRNWKIPVTALEEWNYDRAFREARRRSGYE